MPNPLLSLASTLARMLPMPFKRALYRLPVLARFVRRTLNRAAPAGLTETEIAAGLAAGFRMELDLHSEKDYWLGTYEPDLQDALKALVQPGWTVYDVGANVGYITLMLARLTAPDGRVFAFEALPANQERWRHNVACNALEGRVHLVPAAVTDACGAARFLIGPSDDMGKAAGSAGRSLDYAETIEVPALSLDDFVYAQGNPPPALVKMDIEGGEVLALPGMRRLLQEARPVLLLELHGPESARAAWEALTAAGYSLHRMVRGFPQVRTLDELDWKAYLVGMPDRPQTAGRRPSSTTGNRQPATGNPKPLAPLALQQRVLPSYRAPFFDLLAQAAGGLHLFAGQPLAVESIVSADPAAMPHVQVAWGRNHHFRDPSSRAFLCWQSGLLKWLARIQPRALIVEANPRYLSNWFAVRWMHRRGGVVLGWGLGAPRSGNPLERAFRLAYLRSLDGLIAYSQRGAAQYRALGLQNVFVAHNAAAPRPAAPPPERPWPPAQPLTVLFVGRLQARKRLDLLFRACAALPADLQPRVLVVGDGPARAQFEAAAAAHYPHVRFLGALHGEALRPHFAAADLFVLPGTGGLAVQQAMAHALPVIVAQGDGTQDDLVRPENGWQIPPGDLAALTDTLREALSDPARLRRMGAESYRIVRDEINLERMAAAFVEAVEGRPSPTPSP